eukprot:1440705-Rhodomonas_salina.1
MPPPPPDAQTWRRDIAPLADDEEEESAIPGIRWIDAPLPQGFDITLPDGLPLRSGRIQGGEGLTKKDVRVFGRVLLKVLPEL